MEAHKKPTAWSVRRWNSALRILELIAAKNAVSDAQRDACLSMRELAKATGMTERMIHFHVISLTELRIVGRKMRFSETGQQLVAAMWIMDPAKQVETREIKRSRRVAEVEPQIRQALRDDRESLRSVAKRFGVSADTVQEMRRAIAPYDSDSATVRRCPECGATITSPACLRCSLV